MPRIALVGDGAATDAYACSAYRVPEAKIVAATDGAKLAGKAGIAASHFPDLLRAHADEFDAAVIQTPIDQRANDIRAAAASGKHVLAGCPIAHSAADAQRAMEACADAGVMLVMGQLDHYRSDVEAIRDSITAGHIGSPGLVRSHRWQPSPPGGPEAWGIDPNRTGGLFIHELTRDIDMAIWLFDAAPTEVFAISRGLVPDHPDWAVVHLGFPNGGMAVLDVATSLPHGDAYRSLELIGADGAAYADDHHNMQLLYRGGSPSARLTEPSDNAALRQLTSFVNALSVGSDSSNSAATGILALEITEAAAASAASGQAASRTPDGYTLV